MCNKIFTGASMGEAAVKSHMRSKIHCELLCAAQTVTAIIKFRPIINPATSNRGPCRKEKEIVLEEKRNLLFYMQKTSTLDAEILWTLKSVKCHHSLIFLPLFFNILQLSMDGPNVNLKLHKMVEEHVFNEYGKDLINIGTCCLHVIHNAFRQGFALLNWDIATFLLNIYQLFKYSPARREDFSTIPGAGFPLKFVSHRWVENVPVYKRALEILPKLKIYIMVVEKGKFTQPSTRSFQCIKDKLYSLFWLLCQ